MVELGKEAAGPAAEHARWRALALLSAAELLGMTLWFNAAAAIPVLQGEWGLSPGNASSLTLAVQIGFVAGTFLSALINLPDIVSTRWVFALSAMLAAAANAALVFAPGLGAALPLRFATGFFLAGVYPPGMKLMATWFRQGRGMAIGFLVGALTLGKASPYLINGLAGDNWRANTIFASLCAAAGGAIVLLVVSEGPFTTPNAPFDLRQIRDVFANRAVRLANFGYFGHMWEFYAMWAWAPAMIRASLATTGDSPRLAELSSFLVLGAGALGCIAAGILADRIGRTVVTSWAMGVSGACCLGVGFLYGSNPALLIALAVVWGATVVADSAQFSACITELGNPRYIGTALTLQTCLGFLLTTVSVWLIPVLAEKLGWRYSFMFLAIGPALGVVAMLRLRSLPEAKLIAQGRR